MNDVDLIGGFYKAKSLPFSAQDAVNWMPEQVKAQGAIAPLKLRGVPGLSVFPENPDTLGVFLSGDAPNATANQQTTTLSSVGTQAWFGAGTTGNNVGNTSSSSNFSVAGAGNSNVFLANFELSPNSAAFAGIVATVYVDINSVRVWSESVTFTGVQTIRIRRQINYTNPNDSTPITIGVESSASWNGGFQRNMFSIDDAAVWSSVSPNSSLSSSDNNFGVVTDGTNFRFAPRPTGTSTWQVWGVSTWITYTGNPYSFTYTTTGGVPPFLYGIVSGALPSGLSINSATSQITGSSIAIGSHGFVVRVTDANGLTDDLSDSISVVAIP